MICLIKQEEKQAAAERAKANAAQKQTLSAAASGSLSVRYLSHGHAIGEVRQHTYIAFIGIDNFIEHSSPHYSIITLSDGAKADLPQLCGILKNAQETIKKLKVQQLDQALVSLDFAKHSIGVLYLL